MPFYILTIKVKKKLKYFDWCWFYRLCSAFVTAKSLNISNRNSNLKRQELNFSVRNKLLLLAKNYLVPVNVNHNHGLILQDFIEWKKIWKENNCAFLGYYTKSSDNFLPMFRDNLSGPSSRFLTLTLPLENRTERLLRNATTDRGSPRLRRGSL